MMGRRWARFLPWLLAFLLVSWALYSVSPGETWAALGRLRGRELLALLVMNGLILLLLNARWWVIVRGHGERVSFRALFGYRLATFGFSYFTPGPQFGGEPLQVYLLEKEQRVSRPVAIATVTLDKVLELITNFTFLAAGLLLILSRLQATAAVAAGAGTLAALLVLLPAAYLLALARQRAPLSSLAATRRLSGLWERWPAWDRRRESVVRTIRGSEEEASRFLRQAPWHLAAAWLLSLVAWLLMIGEFWLMVSFLGLMLTPLQLITALAAARLAFLLLLPGGLGVLEASQVLAFGALGLNPAIGISVGLLIRARDVILGAAGLWWGSRKLVRGPLGALTKGGLHS